MGAVILRDLRSRFFNHGLGFLVVPLFPFFHLVILLVVRQVAGTPGMYGDDVNVFLATALIPTLTFMYISRFMSISLVMNRPMLTYPIVKILDVVFARAFLEGIAALWMAAAVMGVLAAVGSSPLPHDPVAAVTGFAATLYLAISAGLGVSLLALAFAPFVTVWALTLVVVYVSSGALFVVSFLPELAVRILAWNPVLHCTEWMRSAYYPGYPTQVLDKPYVLICATALLVAGLVAERLGRRRLLAGG